MNQIQNIADVVRQLQIWKEEIGLGFHCDTPGRDYVKAGGRRSFTREQADEYDALIARCFAVCGSTVDFYDLGMAVIHEPILGVSPWENRRHPRARMNNARAEALKSPRT